MNPNIIELQTLVSELQNEEQQYAFYAAYVIFSKKFNTDTEKKINILNERVVIDWEMAKRVFYILESTKEDLITNGYTSSGEVNPLDLLGIHPKFPRVLVAVDKYKEIVAKANLLFGRTITG